MVQSAIVVIDSCPEVLLERRLGMSELSRATRVVIRVDGADFSWSIEADCAARQDRVLPCLGPARLAPLLCPQRSCDAQWGCWADKGCEAIALESMAHMERSGPVSALPRPPSVTLDLRVGSLPVARLSAVSAPSPVSPDNRSVVIELISEAAVASS